MNSNTARTRRRGLLPLLASILFAQTPLPISAHDKTMIAYYASWQVSKNSNRRQEGAWIYIANFSSFCPQWYDRAQLAKPSNLDHSKVTRYNFAFFQTTTTGEIFGVSEIGHVQLTCIVIFELECSQYLYSPDGQLGRRHRPIRRLQLDGRTWRRNPILFMGYAHWPTCLRCTQLREWADLSVKAGGCGDISKYWRYAVLCWLLTRCHYSTKMSNSWLPTGWTLSDPFPAMAANEASRNKFAQQCVELIKNYDFDGIDIDWEVRSFSSS